MPPPPPGRPAMPCFCEWIAMVGVFECDSNFLGEVDSWDLTAVKLTCSCITIAVLAVSGWYCAD